MLGNKVVFYENQIVVDVKLVGDVTCTKHRKKSRLRGSDSVAFAKCYTAYNVCHSGKFNLGPVHPSIPSSRSSPSAISASIARSSAMISAGEA